VPVDAAGVDIKVVVESNVEPVVVATPVLLLYHLAVKVVAETAPVPLVQVL